MLLKRFVIEIDLFRGTCFEKKTRFPSVVNLETLTFGLKFYLQSHLKGISLPVHLFPQKTRMNETFRSEIVSILSLKRAHKSLQLMGQ